MPCGIVHMNVGAAVGAMTYRAAENGSEKYSCTQGSVVTLAGLIGSKLPDILEPATSPHHRQFFHSWLVLGGVGFVIKKLWEWQPENKNEELMRLAFLALSIGYASHLALDALTKKSLPLI